MRNSSDGSRRPARAAPAIIAAGPLSPPIASMAIRGPPVIVRPSLLGLGRADLAAVIVAAGRAQIVRKLQFAAIGAFLELGRGQRMMAAAHVPLRRRGFSLWDSHCGTFNSNKNGDDLRLISAGCPAGGGRIVANARPYTDCRRGCKGARRVRARGMTPVPITLLTAASAVAIHIWLGSRVVRSRRD